MFNNKCMINNCDKPAVVFRLGNKFCVAHNEKDIEIMNDIELLENKIKNINIKKYKKQYYEE